jgi:hypothetical protein
VADRTGVIPRAKSGPSAINTPSASRCRRFPQRWFARPVQQAKLLMPGPRRTQTQVSTRATPKFFVSWHRQYLSSAPTMRRRDQPRFAVGQCRGVTGDGLQDVASKSCFGATLPDPTGALRRDRGHDDRVPGNPSRRALSPRRARGFSWGRADVCRCGTEPALSEKGRGTEGVFAAGFPLY